MRLLGHLSLQMIVIGNVQKNVQLKLRFDSSVPVLENLQDLQVVGAMH